jgi:hypothetical protein
VPEWSGFKVKKLNNLLIIPGGMTSQLQVLDVVVNKPFKDHLKRQYSNWLHSADHTYTPTRRMNKPVASVLCEWVLEAWNAISSDSIVHGFKKCCISNNLDGNEDDMLWETAR